MLDIQGTTIAANDTVACAVKFGANKVELIIGTIAAIQSDNGQTYLKVNKTARHARYVGDYARVPCDVATNTCYFAVKSGFSATPAEPLGVPLADQGGA